MYSHTIAATCILENNGQFLFIKRPSKEGEFSNQLAFPGGKIHVGEDVAQGLIREIQEEVGVSNLNGLATLAFYKFTRKDGASTQGITCFSKVKDQVLYPDKESVDSYVWFKPSDVIDFLDRKETIYGIEVQVRNACLLLKGLIIPAEAYTITKYQELKCSMSKEYFSDLLSPDFNISKLEDNNWIFPNKGSHI
jgi:8-oxo-dGTP pyrophosphatase MutT (NUDIX family)